MSGAIQDRAPLPNAFAPCDREITGTDVDGRPATWRCGLQLDHAGSCCIILYARGAIRYTDGI